MTKLIFSRFFINLKCSEVNTSFAMIKSKVFPKLPSEQLKISRDVRVLVDLFVKVALEKIPHSFTEILTAPGSGRSTGRVTW